MHESVNYRNKSRACPLSVAQVKFKFMINNNDKKDHFFFATPPLLGF